MHAISYAKASCQVLRKLLRTESAGVGGMAPLIKHFEKITQVEFMPMEKKTFLGEANLAKSHKKYISSGWLCLERGENTVLKLGESVSFWPRLCM